MGGPSPDSRLADANEFPAKFEHLSNCGNDSPAQTLADKWELPRPPDTCHPTAPPLSPPPPHRTQESHCSHAPTDFSASAHDHEAVQSRFVHPVGHIASAREIRETESNQCIGGLRRPARSILGPWAATMRREGIGLAAVLDNVLERFPQCELELQAVLRGGTSRGFPPAAIELAASAVQFWCHAPHTDAISHSPIRAALLHSACSKLEDPDIAWARTLRDGGFDLGTDRPLSASGIFPAVDEREPADADSLQSMSWDVVGGRIWKIIRVPHSSATQRLTSWQEMLPAAHARNSAVQTRSENISGQISSLQRSRQFRKG